MWAWTFEDILCIMTNVNIVFIMASRSHCWILKSTNFFTMCCQTYHFIYMLPLIGAKPLFSYLITVILYQFVFLFFICVKIQMDATHGHCRITWHRHNSLSNASTWNISHSLSLSLQISPQMGLIVLDKEGRGREMKNSKPFFFIDNSSSQTSIQFSCAWVLQRWDVVLPRR